MTTVAQAVDGTGPFEARGADFQQTFLFVPLGQLRESKTNPRRHFDAKGLQELAESIRRQGVLSPLLVRELSEGVAGTRTEPPAYEVVCGARRYRAARLAGVSEVPVRVVVLSDDQVLELQVVENLQREDVHPMDEALGYEALQARGYTGASIAAKVGKSVSYVNARLRFTALGPVARDAFLDGKLSPSVALLVARIPHVDLQARAVKEIVQESPGHEPMTIFEVRRLLQDDYMRPLKGCQFPTTSPTLVPEAGPCSTCPKRTGAQRELFDDVDSPDVCTDPKCFRAKQDAWWREESGRHRGSGAMVVEKKSDAERFLNNGGAYVDLDKKCWEYAGGNGTWGDLLKGRIAGGDIVLVRSPDDGRTVQLVQSSVARKIAKARVRATGSWKVEVSLQKQERARREKAKLEEEFRAALLRTIFEAAPPTAPRGDGVQVPPGVSSEDLVFIAGQMFAAHGCPELVGRIALEAATGEPPTAEQLRAHDPRDTKAFGEALRDLNDAKVMRLLLVLALVHDAAVSPYSVDRKPELITAVCKRYGMSIEDLRRTFMASREAQPKARKAAAGRGKRGRR